MTETTGFPQGKTGSGITGSISAMNTALLPIPAFLGGFAFDAHKGIGDSFQTLLGYPFAAFDAETVFALLYPGKGGVYQFKPFEILGSQGFDHLPVYIVGSNVRQILGIHSLHNFFKILIASDEIRNNLQFKIRQGFFHTRNHFLFHDCPLKNLYNAVHCRLLGFLSSGRRLNHFFLTIGLFHRKRYTRENDTGIARFYCKRFL
jgi:hypothetical protein